MNALSKPAPGAQAMPGECRRLPGGGDIAPPGADSGHHVEHDVLMPINRIIARLQRISNDMREVEQRFRETMQRVVFDRVASDRPGRAGPAERIPLRGPGCVADEGAHERGGWHERPCSDRALASATDRVTNTSWHMCEVTRELMVLHARVASALRDGKTTA
jgi:hypothetical protein